MVRFSFDAGFLGSFLGAQRRAKTQRQFPLLELMDVGGRCQYVRHVSQLAGGSNTKLKGVSFERKFLCMADHLRLYHFGSRGCCSCQKEDGRRDE